MAGGTGTRVGLRLRKPIEDTVIATITEFCAGSLNRFAGSFPNEA